MGAPLFSLITPSRGDRPLALGRAVDSVAAALRAAGLAADQAEMLVGFDGGVRGERPRDSPSYAISTCPGTGTTATPSATPCSAPPAVFAWCSGRRQRTHPRGLRHLPRPPRRGHAGVPHRHLPRLPRSPLPARLDQDARGAPGQHRPLCLCLARGMVLDRCGGWTSQGGYEADFVNMARFRRRSRRMELDQTVVGVYDAGRGLDAAAMRDWQQKARGARPGRS